MRRYLVRYRDLKDQLHMALVKGRGRVKAFIRDLVARGYQIVSNTLQRPRIRRAERPPRGTVRRSSHRPAYCGTT